MPCWCPESSRQVRRLRTHGPDEREETMQSWFGDSMASRNTWSYAPMPSTDNTVAVGLASVNARITCTTQSVPALVERANWKGAHARSTSLLNCLESVFATNLRNDVPVAIPRTPKSLFSSAVMCACWKALNMTCGTAALEKYAAASVNICNNPT